MSGPDSLWKSGSLLLGLASTFGGVTTLYQFVNNAWVPMTTGFAGTLTDFHGSSATRVFATGRRTTPAGQVGHVLSFDGVGWTDQMPPANTGPLTAVWALPTSEVFAVGAGGLILKGP